MTTHYEETDSPSVASESSTTTCAALPDSRQYGSRIVEPCTEPRGHTGCHVSTAADGSATGWHYSMPAPVEPVEPVDSLAVIERIERVSIRERLSFVLAQLVAVATFYIETASTSLDALDSGERHLWDSCASANESRRSTTAVRLDDIETVDAVALPSAAEAAEQCERWAALSERELVDCRAMLDAAIERAASSIERGHMAQTADEIAAAIERGDRAWNDYRRGNSIRGVTLGDLLVYWQARHAAALADISHAASALRASARANVYEDEWRDSMRTLIERDALTFPHWHIETVRPERVPMWRDSSSEPDATVQAAWRDATFAIECPPARLYGLPDSTTAADVLDAITRLHTAVTDDLAAVADAALDVADRRNSCGEYERAVETVNGRLSRWAGAPMHDRNHNYCVDGTATVQVTVEIVVSVSDYVTARSEQDALDSAQFDNVDIDADAIAEALGVDYRTVRGWRITDTDVRDIDADHAERSDY